MDDNLIYIVYVNNEEKRRYNNPFSAYECYKAFWEYGYFSTVYKKYSNSDCLIRWL
jgi:hypothetical protein